MSKIDIHHLTKKQRKQMHGWLRAIIQLLYFLFLPSAYTAAFAGVKYIFTQLGAGEKIGLTSFVSVLIVLCLYTIVFGRFFCGFACAFGSFGDAVHFVYVWICKKIKKKPVKLPETVTSKLSMVKYVVLAVIVLLCFKGVYSQTAGISVFLSAPCMRLMRGSFPLLHRLWPFCNLWPSPIIHGILISWKSEDVLHPFRAYSEVVPYEYI